MRLHKPSVVPLKLLPDINRPLSPRNGADYVRLLSWMYRCPQALAAYIERCQRGQVRSDLPQRAAAALPAHPLNSLFFMSVVVGLGLSVLFAVVYGGIAFVLGGTNVAWMHLLLAGLLGSIIFFVVSVCVVLLQRLDASGVSLSAFIRSVPVYVAVYAAASFILGDMLLGAPRLASFAWLVGLAVGISVGAAARVQLLTLTLWIDWSLQRWLPWGGIIVALALMGMLLGVSPSSQGETSSLIGLSQALLFACVGFGCVVLRPDDWLWARLDDEREPQLDGTWQIPHVTLLKYLPLTKELAAQLGRNWEEGVRNAQRLTDASYQSPYILAEVRRAFAQSSASDRIKRAEFLVEEFLDSDQLFALAPESDTPFVQPARTSPLSMSELWGGRRSPTRRERRAIRRDPLPVTLAVDMPGRAALAGFWYMHKLYPERAVAAFERANGSAEGREMIALAQALEILLSDDVESAKAPLSLPKPPKEPRHKATWDALSDLREAIRCVWVLQRCSTEANVQRMASIATKHLEKVRQNEEIPASERRFLRQIADAWHEDVVNAARDRVKDIQAQKGDDEFKTVKNPFAFAGPLLQDPPVRRKALLAQVQQAWTMGNLQPLLVYGQSLVGKTSLVRSAQQEMESTLETVFVNLRRLSPKASSTQLLQAIASEVADLLATPPPAPDAWQQDEHFVFQSFISQACRVAEPQGLVIILDEFDHIETIMRTPNRRDHILRFLWDLGQAEAQLGFVFITKNTPQELYTQYNNPFSGGLAPVHVGRLSPEETESLLRKPSPEFLPYILEEAVNSIEDLTKGHPYLVQITGYSLVEQYNQAMVAKQPRDPLFDEKDVYEILSAPDLKRRAAFYFQAVLQEVTQTDAGGDSKRHDSAQAGEERKGGIERVLCALSGARDGMSEAELERIDPQLECVHKLAQHDVVQRDDADGRWRIGVEMLRQWLEENPPA